MITSKEYVETIRSFYKRMDTTQATSENDELENELNSYRESYNRELIKRYPWLQARDEHGNKLDTFEYTELDCLDDGWRVAFGDELIEEVDGVYQTITDEQKENFYPLQIKEKFGTLRWYNSIHTEELDEILIKYECRSEKTCIHCGKPAKFISTGWICPWCEECVKDIHGKVVPIEE